MKAATPFCKHCKLTHVISIHAAREGGDAIQRNKHRNAWIFQSTPPVKAATDSRSHRDRNNLFQSTPPVKAATIAGSRYTYLIIISIHAAREGGDDMDAEIVRSLIISIHAAREGGDVCLRLCNFVCLISIHAAREGGDAHEEPQEVEQVHFNPRRP